MNVDIFKNALNTDARYAVFNEVKGDQYNTAAEQRRSPIDTLYRKIGKKLSPPRSTGSTTDGIILVLGASGAGKSKFINMAAGTSKPSIGDGLRSCTNETQSFMLTDASGRKIRIIDTPGFDHTAKSDVDVLREIANCLSTIYQKRELLTGIVYMHRGDEFMGRNARRNFSVIQKLCGDDALSNMAIVIDICDKIDPKGNGANFGKYDSLFQAVLDKHGQLFYHHNADSAKSIISSCMNNNPKPLQIQRELVDKRMNLYQTEAGNELRTQLRADVDLLDVI